MSLAMVLSFTANFTGVMAATEGVNVVKIEYYSDKDLADAHKVESVEVGDTVYAALKINAFTGLRTFTITFGYDSASLALVCSDGTTLYNNGVVTDDEENAFIGDNGFRTRDDGIEQYDIERSSFRATTSQAYPKLWQKSGLAMLTLTWGPGPVNVTSEKTIAVLAFKALKKNDAAGICIPVALDDVDDEIHDGANYRGVTVATSTGSFGYNECDLKLSPLKITTEQLNAPDVAFDAENRVISWNAIDKASGYKVAIQVSKNGGAPTYSKEFDVPSTQLSMDLPAEITNGDVKVAVMAVSNDTNLGNSDYSLEKTAKVTLDLKAPANVAWDGEKVKWDAVDNATGYEVKLMLNESVTPVATIPNTTETTVDFSNELKTPTEGKNSYKVIVKALGDNVYTFNSAEGESKVKNICGSVKTVVSAEWNGNFATWVENDDKANVAGYIVCVKKDGGAVYTNSMENLVQGSSIDVSDYIKEPGKYTFTVTAIGASTADGEYKNSTAKISKNTKTVSKQLDPVENIEWADRVVTWTDNNTNTSVYEVKLYKGTELVGTYSNITETKIDFDAVGANVGAGTYKVEIVAKGDGDVYLNSTPATSEKEFTQRLDDPANVKWDGTKATWNTVANAYAYEIALFYNGVDTGIREYAYEPTTEFDVAEDLTLPGEYTFTVKALANNGYSASKAVKSEDPAYNNTGNVTKQGTVAIKLYEDAACATPATDIRVGDTFYAAVALESVPAFGSYCAPIKFNPEYVKVIDNNNAIVNDGTLSEELLAEEDTAIFLSEYALDNGFSIVSSGGYPYVDNTNGLIKFIAMTPDEKAITTETVIFVVKMTAIGMADSSNTLDFAVANPENDLYDESSMAGFSLSSAAQAVIIPNFTPTTVAIAKGQLAKMAAPVWSNSTLTWVKAAGNNAVGYEIELYRDGNLIETIKINDADATSENMSAYTSTSGTYTAKIKALADNVGATDGEYSDISEGYTVSYGGGGFGGGKKPTKPVEPDKPDEPDKPVDPEKPEFTDITGHWAEKDILELVDLGIVDGYGDNTFRPNLGITRAEFTKLMVTCLGAKLEGEGHVYDDTANHWAKDYIAIGTELGIVNGIGENLFDPDRIITREQVAAIIYRMAGKPEVAASTFADRDDISDYAKSAVDYVSSEGIMIGIGNNMFGGRDNINRAQMATVILRLWKANFFANYKN